MADDQVDPTPHQAGPFPSDRVQFWIALTIALVPLPFALLISLALGSPPWKARPPAGPVNAPGHPHR